MPTSGRATSAAPGQVAEVDGSRRGRGLPSVPYLLLGPNFIWLGLFLVGPLCLMLAISFRGYQAGVGVLPTWELGHYARFLADPFYRGILWNTLILGIEVTLLCIVLAIRWPTSFRARADG